MSLPWWDIEELSQVRTLPYPVREHDMPTWGLMKFEVFRDFKHWKPHYPKKIKRVDPVTGVEETILQIKKPRVYRCITIEAISEYRVGNEIRNIHLYDPMWIVNCFTKDIECLFVNKIGYKAEDKDQALQFQKVSTICFHKGINSETIWLTRWRKIEKEEALKAKKKKEDQEEKDKIARATCLQRLADEEQRDAKENEKLRKLLLRKPKQREEKFKSL
ncbi:hypothetical protein Hanom_Chr07g00629531 [Helianthus anomalus]